jgi:putative spermidine/putrescine transport system substrate-binding protein
MQKNAPIGLEWTEGALKQGTFVIPRGAKEAYWAQRLLALMAQPKGQAVYANALGYPGLHPDSAGMTDPKVLPFLPNAPENLAKQFWISDRWWAQNGANAIERWNAWMLKS